MILASGKASPKRSLKLSVLRILGSPKSISPYLGNFAKLPKYGEIDLGDPRIRSTDSLRDLLGEAFPDAKINIETNVVSMEGPVAKVAETTAGFFYASFILPSEVREIMLSKLSSLLTISKQSRDLERQGRFSMPINRLVITK